jgi:two-component system phosphate regulon sensor histidine kinase PhoR
LRNRSKNILVPFALIVLLPVAFIVYELGQLNRNEKIVRETYQHQLDAILYSVNQYADDLISSWANRIRLTASQTNPTDKGFADELRQVMTQADVVRYVYFAGTGSTGVTVTLDSRRDSINLDAALRGIVRQRQSKLDHLIEYGKQGFIKMEAIDTVVAGNCIPVFFVLDDRTTAYRLGVMLINGPAFIKKSLAPKLQAIAQGQFVISANRSDGDSLVYSTEKEFTGANPRKGTPARDDLQRKNFWTLPGYYISIEQQGTSIEGLVRDRTYTSLTVLGLLTFLFAIGAVFLYRSIRREMQLAEAKAAFVSNVSHELRTPLSLIGMFAETLESGRATSEEKKKEYYGIMTRETARLSRIVRRILSFSQLEANKRVFTFEPVDLHALCVGIMETYFYPLREKGFRIELESSPDLPAISADREAISEVIINLLDNAVKYSRDRKSVTLKTGTKDGNVFVEVRDEGIGIAKAHQESIFEQFYRAPTGDVHTTQGSGLGLTLVKNIMRAHHGAVTVSSTPGKGSTFRIQFPGSPPIS